MGVIDGFKKQASVILKKGITDDSSVHLLNRLYCVGLLVILTILVGSKQYVGTPIACWCPAMFTGQHVKYTNNYCWISNTYYIDFESNIPSEKATRSQKEIEFYQWVPLIFLFQAMLFYLPRIFWKQFGSYAFINIKKTICMAAEATYLTGDKREKSLEDIVSYLEKYIKIRNGASSSYRKLETFRDKMAKIGLHYGNFLIFLFLATSFFYIISTVVQFVLVDVFLGNDFKNLGFEFITKVLNGKKMEDYRRFPRVTFCDVDVRQMTNVQTWTVQCSLPINLFNEKMFLLDWAMLVIMITANCMYFVYHFSWVCFPSRAKMFVCNLMEIDNFRLSENRYQRYKEVQTEFVQDYLRNDGVFIFWLINSKTNNIITREIVRKLWTNYSNHGLVHAKLHVDDKNYITAI